MYENLLRELMYCPDAEYGCSNCQYQKVLSCREKLMKEAVKAIEELSSLIDLYGGETGIKSLREYASKYWDLLKNTPRWIPVKERLPKKENKIYWICTDAGYQCECRWTNNRFGIGESDEWGWSIMDVPQYHKVVAWMFLPEPYETSKEK